jgi:uncharacterized protein (DUF486 family)
LFVLAYPLYVIRPFRHQGSRELAVALAILRATPYFDALLVSAAIVFFIFSWKQSAQPFRKDLLRRIAAGITLLLVIVFAGLSRINIYEYLLFRPLDRPSFSRASDSKLDGDQEVIAVRISNTARAYPIRILSYHHIVNDVLGGLPIVATY